MTGSSHSKGLPADDGVAGLLERARAGEAGALDDLFSHVRAPTERWIACRLGPSLRSRLDVEDVLQETLTAAFRGIAQFEGNRMEALLTWLRTIAENRIRDASDWMHAKRRSPERERFLRASLQSARTSPSIRAVQTEEHERLLETLVALPVVHREILRLVRLEGRSHREAAELLGISEKNAGVRLVRALKALRVAAEGQDATQPV